MEKVNVSVIIPMYNSEKTIRRCIKSVINQTLKFIEIIVVDDGSSDSSVSLVNHFTVNDERVLLICKNNGGVSSARNIGLMFAKGEYIFFLDSDDYISVELLESMYNMAAKLNIDLVGCSMYEFNNTKSLKLDNSKESIFASTTEEIGEKAYNLYLASACGKLFKNEIIKYYKIYFLEYMSLAEDLEFVHNYLLHVNNIAKTEEGGYYIENINLNSLSKRYAKKMKETLLAYRNIMSKAFSRFPKYEENYYKFHMAIEMELVVIFVNNLYLNKSPYTGKIRLQEIKKYLFKEKNINSFVNVDSKYLPKNKLNKIYYMAFLTRSVLIVDFVFWIKQRVKKIIWKKGLKKCL